MYIVPGYIHKILNEDHLLLENQMDGKIIELENQYLREYNEIYKNHCDELNTELTMFLHDQDFLLTKEEMHDVMNEYCQAIDHVLHIVIMVTEQCNFRCKYCYEDFQVGKMQECDLDTIVDFIKRNLDTNQFDALYISWFGGEPTLEKQLIFKYAKIIKALVEEYPIKYASSMTTNGYLLDINEFKRFIDMGISVYQITLDGFCHNDLRVLRNGDATLEVILNHLIRIKNEIDQDFEIIIRHNVLDGDTDFTWYDFLKDIFRDDKRFFIDVHKISKYSENAGSLNLIENDKSDILALHENYINQIGLQLFERKELLSKLCYAMYQNSFTFRPNKKIVKCTVELNHEKNLIGEMNKRGIILDEEKISSIVNPFPYEDCYICEDFCHCRIRACPRNRMVLEECHSVKRGMID